MRSIIKERLLATLVVVSSGVFLINEFRPLTENDKKFDWDRLWVYKTHSEKKYSHVVCGDSRVYRGVSASAIERNLRGASVFNYGYSSGSFSSFMLAHMENKLDMSSSNPTLVLGITPYSLTGRASEDGHIKEELSRKREEIIEFLYLEPVKRFFEPISVELMLNVDGAESAVGPVYRQQPYYREGWVASSKTPPNPKEALAIYVKDFEGNRIAPTMVDTLILKIKEWRAKGIHVFAFRPPTTAEMVKLEDSLSGFNEQDFRKRFENSGGVWLAFSSADFESYDGSHLTRSSAIEFSEQIGRRIGAIELRGR